LDWTDRFQKDWDDQTGSAVGIRHFIGMGVGGIHRKPAPREKTETTFSMTVEGDNNRTRIAGIEITR
jgi:hypothetical protein